MSDVFVAPDVERATVDLLAGLAGWEIADVTPPTTVGATTVGVGLPSWWKKVEHGPHLEVAWDGGDQARVWGGPVIVAWELVRITSWSDSTSTAKALVVEAIARLDAYPGGQIISGFNSGQTRPVPARDPDTGAEMATAATSATVRTIPLT